MVLAIFQVSGYNIITPGKQHNSQVFLYLFYLKGGGFMEIRTTASSLNPYIASGKNIVSAADDPSGLGIVEKMKQQTSGLDQGTANAAQGKDLMQTADSALGSIQDLLQRIKDISVKASNTAVYNADDLQAMQDEVGQLMSGIQDVAKNTSYNNQKLLDGSLSDFNLATNPSGGGRQIKMANATLSSLGLEGYDVTKEFDMNRIDQALSSVSEKRSSLGAQSNGLSNLMNANRQTSLDTTSSQSRIDDLDMAKAVSEKEKLNIIDQYKVLMQKREEDDRERRIENLMRP